MEFVGYGPAAMRGVKIDWDVAGVRTQDLLNVLASYVNGPEDCRIGVLRRPFIWEPGKPGRRSKRVIASQRPRTVHCKGSIVVAYPDESWFLVEHDSED